MSRSTKPSHRIDHNAAVEPNARSGLQFRSEHGVLTLFIEGRAVTPLIVDLTADIPLDQITAFASAGVPIYRLRHLDLGWTSATHYDYSALDQRVSQLLASDPNARFLLEISVDAPDWWCAAHPQECVAFAESVPSGSPPKATASCASVQWRRETSRTLARLVQHLLHQAWGGNCIGIQIAAGVGGAWQPPNAELLPDVGPRMTERFRAFAVEKYRRNEGLLRKEWDDPRADFSRIKCPGARERRFTDMGVFRSPVRSRRMLDYFECYYGAQNEAMLEFAGAVKKAADGKLVVGVACARVFDAATSAEAIQGFPEPLFDASEIDFFILDVTAEPLQIGTLTGSLGLRGKFLFITAAERIDIAVTGLALTHNAGLVLPQEVKPNSLQRVAHLFSQRMRPASGPRRRVSQVAVIVDPSAAIYLGSGQTGEELLHILQRQQIEELAQIGAPFDVFMVADLFHPGFRDYKVYLFLNTFYFSEAERRRMEARVKRSEQVAVWLWAPGILSETGIEADAGQRVTGQKLRLEPGETSLRVRIVESGNPLTWGFHNGATFGSERAFAPTITVADRRSARLGANSANKTVFATQQFGNWTSVIFGTAPIPASLLRNVLRSAGCHLYLDAPATGDVVFADERSVGLTSRRGGQLKLSLPGSYEVTDAVSGDRLGVTSDLAVELKPGASAYYLLRPAGRTKRD